MKFLKFVGCDSFRRVFDVLCNNSCRQLMQRESQLAAGREMADGSLLFIDGVRSLPSGQSLEDSMSSIKIECSSHHLKQATSRVHI